MQAYSDTTRESDVHALPDVEVFYVGLGNRGEYFGLDDNGIPPAVEPGFYYWFCFPGCLPDGEPVGPFATKAEALADAQGGGE